CNARCTTTPVTACAGGDGCCPAGCTPAGDSDCSATCGNGILEPGETCDPERTCPRNCNDGNACTTDVMTGSRADCNVVCTHAPITACAGGDGCCPAGCTNAADADCPAGPPVCTDDTSWPAAWATFETQVVTEMNARRAAGATCTGTAYGSVPPLAMEAALRRAARCHSMDMGMNGFFSHTGSDGSSFVDRVRRAGYTGSPLGENIAGGQATPAAAVASWMGSTAGHCEAIMSPRATEIGIGYFFRAGSPWTHYWTAVFGRR
ncbi:MAG: CAP domain-containing protein, partial [Myxococcota bacterium]|nr:CAP domain-containing protein [Myxococcota bacterium]